MRVHVLLPVFLALLVSLPGCGPEPRRDGPEMVKVKGTVTLDGEPVEGAHIRFGPMTQGPAAVAISDKRGRYELRTFDPGDGAVPGKYGISVTKEVTEGGMEFESQAAKEAYIKEHNGPPPPRTTKNVLPEKYASNETSGLTVEITLGGKNRFDLQLESE